MNVLHVVEEDGFIVVEPKGVFAHPVNQRREIQVDDPADPFGAPIYSGPAMLAAKYLVPGAYWYVWADDDLYSD